MLVNYSSFTWLQRFFLRTVKLRLSELYNISGIFLVLHFPFLKLPKQFWTWSQNPSGKQNPTTIPLLHVIVARKFLHFPFILKKSIATLKVRVPKMKHAIKENYQNIGRLVTSPPWNREMVFAVHIAPCIWKVRWYIQSILQIRNE